VKIRLREIFCLKNRLRVSLSDFEKDAWKHERYFASYLRVNYLSKKEGTWKGNKV